ncbi:MULTISPECIES: hypothetical protein [Sphingomonas]|jgi:hypothetical protein|uniref:Uncharacterized protein n=2 Tax=Sphingomonas TaxID=13687 RepID=A0A7W9BT26_9SPHN|nr:hypothetical protein [Sphingomonas prati]MBB5729098.1 hypothetical protein [Sphingomonas prati]GGE85147.1 hypothetical protein GCM10011404_17350 [Sphingomonas prati]
MADDNLENHASVAGAAAGGPNGNEAGDPNLTEEQRIELRRRRAMASAVDDADASHQGGMGAQGAAVDFGKPKNFGLPD